MAIDIGKLNLLFNRVEIVARAAQDLVSLASSDAQGERIISYLITEIEGFLDEIQQDFFQPLYRPEDEPEPGVVEEPSDEAAGQFGPPIGPLVEEGDLPE
jgi:hypothetical protein